MKMTKWMTRIAICTAAPLPMSYSAIAQDSPEAIIVTGEYGEAPDSVRTLSQEVSYPDLDLGKEAGRDMRWHRVSLTARFLCDKLGETNSSSPIVASRLEVPTSETKSLMRTSYAVLLLTKTS